MNTFDVFGQVIFSLKGFLTNAALNFFFDLFMFFHLPDQLDFMTEQGITNFAIHFSLSFRMANICVVSKAVG